MKVLVAFASRHGSTQGIAEHIARTLTGRGITTVTAAVEDVERLDDVDAIVLGGAAYLAHWLKPAVRFATEHEAELSSKPVWLFSSGPLGTNPVDAEGQDVLESARPKEFDELSSLLRPRGEHVFFGAYDPAAPPVGLGERVVRHLPAARGSLPGGDFRDWEAISAWAEEIAADLQDETPQTGRTVGGPEDPVSEDG